MMKKIGKSMLALGAGTVLMFSCSKKDNNVTNNATANQPGQYKVISTDGDDAANPANPYDYAGRMHNNTLQATRSVWHHKDVSPSDAYDAMEAYLKTTPYASDDNKELILSQTQALLNDASNQEVNFINSQSLSSKAKDYELQLSAIFNNLGDKTYSDVKTAVVALESTVLGDNSLSQGEQKQVLESCSVARYSLMYWLNEGEGSNDNGSTQPPTMVTFGLFKKIHDFFEAHPVLAKIVGVALEDAGGALGGIVGAAVASGVGAAEAFLL